jgi:pimeloyl-ACP methyl ester carboxylesterase
LYLRGAWTLPDYSASTKLVVKHFQPMRRLLRLFSLLLLVLIGLIALLYFRQHSMIYHPRPYDAGYARSLPPNGVAIEYSLPAGKQTAYYIPGSEPVPKRLWLAFCGNGSLALDWVGMLHGYPANGDAFLLIDYPGYGKNSGYAAIDSTRASTKAALHALAARLQMDEENLPLSVIGHSLGAAVALDFAAHHRVQRVVAIAPFTSLREEAAQVVGGPLSYLLIENYDNRKTLAKSVERNPGLRVAIFHGTDDEVIPFRMGRQLAQEFKFVEFFPVEGGDHIDVLTLAREQMIAWMNR